MSRGLRAWQQLIGSARPVFTRPSFLLFSDLVDGWVICPLRRTVTGILRMADPSGRRAHDAYHRFLRAGAWSMQQLWKHLTVVCVHTLRSTGPSIVDIDDTLFHKTGHKIAGAGIFRDPLRSTARRVAYALGLNVVVVTLRITPPWGGEPLGLPINARLHRKDGPTLIELAAQMLAQISGWLPDRHLQVCADGAYASLAGAGLEHVHVCSRMRRDAAIFEPPPPRTGKRGRPRKRGARLACPATLARTIRRGFVHAEVDVRGKTLPRLIYARTVLWYHVIADRQVLLVIVRDPQRRQPDDFFFTTDLSAHPTWVAGHYAGRWSIEDTFRNVKQHLGGQQPQSWSGHGPERAAMLSMWIYTAVWCWYIRVIGTRPSWPNLPWYTAKRTPSFPDALATLRRQLWHNRIFDTTQPRPLTPKTAEALIDALARAA